jgi:hypothetical protein
MRKLFCTGLFLSLLAPVCALAQSPFDGTWKTDVGNAQLPKKPEVYLLQGGVFKCESCAPPYEFKADGQDQSIAGQPYFDTASAKIVDDWTVEVSWKKVGKLVGSTKYAVSMDGNTLTTTASYNSPTTGETVSAKEKYVRVAKGPMGSHGLSGSWRPAQIENMSENALLFTLKIEGDSLTMSEPTGEGYTAKLDGTEAPFHGDPGTTSVSVKQIGKNTIEETDKRNGKVVLVTRMTVAADGRSMMLSVEDKERGTNTVYEADKQ